MECIETTEHAPPNLGSPSYPTLRDGTPAVLEPPPGSQGRFWKGMPAAKKKGALHRRRKIYEFLEKIKRDHELISSDPAELLMYMGATGLDPLADKIIEDVGREKWEAIFPRQQGSRGGWTSMRYIALETRIDCLKAAMPYIHPRLNSISMTTDEKPELDQRNAVAQSMARDPKVRDAMELIQASYADTVMNQDGDAE